MRRKTGRAAAGAILVLGPNGIVFSARDQEHGVELWGLNPRQ
jgi:hypothetical protein